MNSKYLILANRFVLGSIIKCRYGKYLRIFHVQECLRTTQVFMNKNSKRYVLEKHIREITNIMEFIENHCELI